MGAYYVTTAIPYVNAEPHLGFALELVQADVFARFHRLRGDDTRFLTGTDENSLTNVLAAERAGLPVRDLVDRQRRALPGADVACWASRTTTSSGPRPTPVISAALGGSGKTASGEATSTGARTGGCYCVRCERFFAPDELVDGRCPEHATVPEVVEEENYFFRLSRYGDRPRRGSSTSGTLRVIPEARQREVRAFVDRGLEDFSISRIAGPGARLGDRGAGRPGPGDVRLVRRPDQLRHGAGLRRRRRGRSIERYWRDEPAPACT